MDKPAPNERSFGLSVGTALLVLGAIALWRHRDTVGTVMVTIGAVLLVFGLIAPRVLRVPNRVWWRFAQTLGWINARIILSVFFFVVLTPVGIVMRAIGRNPLRGRDAGSNWGSYPAGHADAKHFEHLF